MKLAYFDDFKLGVVVGDGIVDVMSAVRDIPHLGPADLINGVIARFAEFRPKIEAAAKSGKAVPLTSVKLRAPLPKPATIDCMAVNYMEDGTRDAPAPINAFHKSPSAIIGPGDTMVLPDVPASVFEGEAEVAVVIGKRASNVKAADGTRPEPELPLDPVGAIGLRCVRQQPARRGGEGVQLVPGRAVEAGLHHHREGWATCSSKPPASSQGTSTIGRGICGSTGCCE